MRISPASKHPALKLSHLLTFDSGRLECFSDRVLNNFSLELISALVFILDVETLEFVGQAAALRGPETGTSNGHGG